MASSLCSATLSSPKATPNPGHQIDTHQRLNLKTHNLGLSNFSGKLRSCCVRAQAGRSNTSDERKKPNSVICADCDGNGAITCTQCKGKGVNSVELFNGRFKVGDDCWLCGGKNDVLCGNCNGAGFIGGFMSTYDQ